MEPFTFFISYRREDTAPIALLLKHQIEKRLQFVRVLVDVEELHPGDAFPDRLKQLIESSHAMIVLIGKNWMQRCDASQSPVNSNEQSASEKEDWIVTEVQYAEVSPMRYMREHQSAKRILLPIFVDCEANFKQFELPEGIANLAAIQSESINYGDWPNKIGELIDRLAVQLNLKTRPDKDEYPKPDNTKAKTQLLSDDEVAKLLSYEEYEGWYVDNFGDADVRYLVKTFEFGNFNQSADFMEKSADHCRVLGHHPEWRNVYNFVHVSLTTWAASRRITIYDLNLALVMNKIALQVLPRGQQ